MRLNEALLQRLAVIKQIEQAISRYLAINDILGYSVSLLWEALKAVMRVEFIAITAMENKIRKENRETMTKLVLEVGKTHKPRFWRQLEAAHKQLAGLDQDREEYALLELRHSFYVVGNCTGWLLASRLQTLRQSTGVEFLRSHKGNMIRGDGPLTLAFHQFYEALYAADTKMGDNPETYIGGGAPTV
ncbi:hypothetical protein NDU88_002097 [Pleurodeles waltl]|uniref:Uncharacterized protein n=1 Tax=Pleurodeles waltl TaxID=8319 RepID=A0AAV7NCR3_PLEWA|nr:hypothetical protein NDU88_002097 [Pleurodeles waltl]